MADKSDDFKVDVGGDTLNLKETLEAFSAMSRPVTIPDWLHGQYEDDNLPIFRDNKVNIFIPGSHFRHHLDVDLSYSSKPSIVLGEDGKLDPRIQKLGDFAKTFKEAADRKICPTPEDAQIYLQDKLKFDISIEDAKAIQGDNQVKKEVFYAQTFHKQIHDVFGEYNGEVIKFLNLDTKNDLKTLDEIKFKPDGHLDPNSFDNFTKERLGLYKQERKTIKLSSDGAEHFKDIGKEPGQYNPVCRHYAPVMSYMLDQAGIENCMFTCNQGGHATVVSLRTGNIFETTATKPEDNYRYCLTKQQPGDIFNMKLRYFTTIGGNINSINLLRTFDFTPDNLEQGMLTENMFHLLEKKIGKDKFGQTIAEAQIQGKPLNNLPTLSELKSMPANERPQLTPEEQHGIDIMRKIQKSTQEPFPAPSSTTFPTPPKQEILPVPHTNKNLSSIEPSVYEYGNLPPPLLRNQKPSQIVVS